MKLRKTTLAQQMAETVTGSRERVWEHPLDRGKLENRLLCLTAYASGSCLCHELMSYLCSLMRSFVLVVVIDCAVLSSCI